MGRGVRPIEVRSPRILHPHERRPWLWWMLGGLLALLAGWQVYQLGRAHGGLERRELATQVQTLRQRLSQDLQTLERIRAEAARYRRDAEVERTAGRELQQELARLQEQQARLQTEVRLLKQLVASGTGATLYLRDFLIRPGAEARRYRYRFTLVQLREGKGPTRGKLLLKVSGQLGKKKVTLDRSQLAPDGDKAVKLEFTNFQDLEGELVLPEGFRPQQVIIEFLPRGKSQKKFQIAFPWPRTVEQNHA